MRMIGFELHCTVLRVVITALIDNNNVAQSFKNVCVDFAMRGIFVALASLLISHGRNNHTQIRRRIFSSPACSVCIVQIIRLVPMVDDVS